MIFGQPVTLTATGTITPAVGWNFYPIGFQGALTATIGGALNITFVVKPN
jgi:hypothetical protein